MAVTKIWDVRGSLEAPIKYVSNEEKTENINQNIIDRNNNIAELDVAASIANSEKYNTTVNTANGFETDSIGAEFDAHAFDDLMKELGVEPLPMEENETN